MIDPGINPHELAIEELKKAIAEGKRFAFDMDVVVLTDLETNKSERE